MTTAFELSEKRQLLLERLLRKEGVAPAARPGISRRAGTGPAPLSFGQQRLWFLQRLEPGSSAYNLTEALRLRGALDVHALERALAEVVRRHQVLRTVFPAPDGEPVQEVLPWSGPPLPRADLADLPEPARAAETARLAAALARTPFDLERGPLFAPALLRLASAEHLLVLRIHHAVADGWSMALLVRELTTLYASYAAGRSSPLPEPPLQYADFATWQRGHLQGEVLEDHLRFWKERLAGAPGLLELPTDRPRPAVQTWHGGRVPVRLPAVTTAALRELGRSHGATPFMVLAAALGALLLRYTGQDDVLLGTPVAHRSRPEIEDVIGFFVNTLVLRLDLSGDPAFPVLLARVRAAAMDADAHQDLPFEKLVDALELPRDLSRSPLFQVMLTFQNLPPAGGAQPRDLEVRPYGFEVRTAQFDLHFLLAEGPRGLDGELEYRTDLFDAPTAQRLARHFEALLTAVAGEPGSSLWALPLLSSAELHQALVEWNDTAAPYPELAGGLSLHALLAAQEQRTPGAAAVSFEGRHVTYAELGERARALARRLRTLGCGPESRVAVAMERSAELLVALRGILEAGAAYVPLDPDYPRERLAFMLEDACPAALLTQERLRPSLPDFSGPVLCLDRDEEGSAGEAGAEVAKDAEGAVPAHGLQLAYVIYTSGSTGRPKGAMVHHRAIVNRLLWMQEAYGLTAEDAVLQKTPFSFDVSVWELFWPLLTGARLVLARPGGHRDPAYLADLIGRESVTVLHFVPSMLQAFLEHPDLSSCAGLRLVVASGEALPAELAGRCRERLPGARLENLYGPTEAAVDVTRWSCDGAHAPVPIGRPIANVQIHLLDPGLRPAPLGVPGELWIGGVNVGRGCLGRPDLTAERFGPDPWSPEPGSRLYRTGDLARRLPGGEIEYLGRLDHQVKIRGFRIELGEIEAALASHPAVREAAVALRDDRGSRRLVAYVVPRPGTAVSHDDLRVHLQERLPEHMVPAAWVILDALPLSPNGKLDRRALPAPGTAGHGGDYVPPETPAEAVLAEVWAEVLGVDRVSVHDGFFGLGGDSILSLRLLARARDFGYELTLQQVFQHQTLRELARVAVSVGTAGAGEPVAPFALLAEEDVGRLPAELEDAYPLARLQAGLLFHSELDAGTAVYHDILSHHLVGPFDEDALRQAVGLLLSLHPVLRTSFDLALFSEPLQLVHRTVEPEIGVEDIRHLDLAAQESAVRAWMEREKARPFDWTRPPLLRFQVHVRGERSFQLAIGFHHAILDGWSLSSMQSELLRIYLALLHGETPREEPDRSAALHRFVALERQALASAESRRYWLDRISGRISGATESRLPRWSAAPERRGRRGAHTRDLPLPLSLELRRAARSLGLPLKSVLLAAHARVLAALCGQEDVVTGLVSNGRPEEPGAERALGLFLNTLPFFLRLPGGTWADLARGAFTAERELLLHRRFPVAELQREAGGRPLFEAVFNFVHFHVLQGLAQLDEIRSAGGEYFEETSFTLLASFSQDPFTAQLQLRLEHDADELTGPQVEALWDAYARLLAAFAADPEARYEAFPLLTDAERSQLRAWNETARPLPAAAGVHELLEARAARTPHLPAVEAEGLRLTYRELDERAERLAAALRARGVRPDDPVGLCLERSPAQAVAVLGILKAGGAYVPLDPAYPRERLEGMAGDAGLRLLLADEHGRSRLPESLAGARVFPLGPGGEVADGEGAGVLGRAPGGPLPDGLAYVLFTSGSTGRPKGVAMPHRALVNLIAWQLGEMSADPALRTLQFASLSFDVSFQEMFATWASGGTLVLVPEEVRRDATALLRFLREQEIGRLFLPFVALQQLAEAVAAGGEPPAGLREVITAGEQLQATGAVAELFRRLPGCRLVNHYGPTEAHVVAAHPLPESPEAWPVLPPIGRPVANVRIHLLDRHLQPAPPGVPGELCIAGAALARGYLGRPDLTAERFLPDPSAGQGGEPGGRIYRTGDLASHRRTGDLDYLGRVDHQVKIRGFRVEPGEIEVVLAGHPSVRAAAVVVRGEGSSRRLIAYVAGGPERPEAAELARWLRERLPDYMVPAGFVLLDALPLTPSGKIDRRALPAAETAVPGAERPYVAPRSSTEEILARLWAEALGVERVGVHDGFLDLGGHSLLAMQLLPRIRQAFQTDLPLRALFEAGTVAALATRLDESSRGERTAGGTAAPELPRISEGPVDRHAPIALADVQEAYWIGGSGLFDLGAAGANLYLEYDFAGALWSFAPSLEIALRRLVQRHEILRTVVLPDGRQQVLAEVPPFEVGAEDLSGQRPERVESRLEEVREELQYSRLPASRWPRFEVVLHQLDDGRIRLHARFDAMLLDGTARGVLIAEVVRLLADADAALPELGLSFLDYARALEAFQETETWRRSRDYWLARLPSLPPAPRLPLAREIGPATVPRITKRTPDLLSAGDWLALRHRATRAGLTASGLLTAAFAEALRPWCAEPSFTLGLVGSHHPPVHPDIERVLGTFNSLHLLAVEDGPGSFLERARRLQDRLREDLDHVWFSGHRVLRELNRRRQTGTRATLPVLFDSVVDNGAPSGERVEAAEPPRDTLDLQEIDLRIIMPQVLLLCVAFEAGDGSLGLVCQAVEEVLPDGTVPRLLDGFRDLLRRLATEEAAWAEPRPAGGHAALAFPSEPPSAAAGEAAASRRTAESWDPVETALADLWEDLLGRRPETASDGFFELGGDSLLAVRLLAKINGRWGREVPPADLLARPTLEGVAEVVRRGLSRPSTLGRLGGWLRNKLTSTRQPSGH